MNRSESKEILPLSYFLLRSVLGFGLVCLVVFATVAFGQRWMYQHLGLAGAYSVWALLFVGLGGWALNPLAEGFTTRLTFFLTFGVAFLTYAVCWISAYFSLGGRIGEWVGSLAGSVAFGLVLTVAHRVWSRCARIALTLFLCHSVGYFVGEAVHHWVTGVRGMILWGLCYGLGFGLGLGYALYQAQRRYPSGARLTTQSKT